MSRIKSLVRQCFYNSLLDSSNTHEFDKILSTVIQFCLATPSSGHFFVSRLWRCCLVTHKYTDVILLIPCLFYYSSQEEIIKTRTVIEYCLLKYILFTVEVREMFTNWKIKNRIPQGSKSSLFYNPHCFIIFMAAILSDVMTILSSTITIKHRFIVRKFSLRLLSI